MIKVTGLNKKEFIINSDQIEKMEEIPECLITLVNGNKYIVLESCEEIIEKIIAYKHRILIGQLLEEQE